MKYLSFFVSAGIVALVMGGLVHLAQATAPVPASARLGQARISIPMEIPIYNPDEAYGEEMFRQDLPSRTLSDGNVRERSMSISVINRNGLADCYDRRGDLHPLEQKRIGRRVYCLSASLEAVDRVHHSSISYTTPYFNQKLLVLQLQLRTPYCSRPMAECDDALLVDDTAYFERIIQSLLITR